MKVQAPPIYCALRFLLQWLRSEKALHSALVREASADTIRESLAYFQVARGFPGIHRANQAQFIAHSLLKAESHAGLSPSQRVVFLAEQFQGRFGRFNLSAASKLLWLRKRRPYVLLDARAKDALVSLGKRFDPRNYAQYVDAWREAYAEVSPTIAQASASLVALPDVASSVAISGPALGRLVSQPWFHERVFDTYLWERGGDG